ncbi:CGNR zinc finger domain-containing protein [Saccharopolyspora sp. NPDC050642]|uniref:CGNR zinc finger domain-containing protein n=1 Tax=Saccharopolyspora sp. NPDC050642 TaxID=3157099 RepID=UPI0033D929DF
MSTHAFEDWSVHRGAPAEVALAVDFANTVDQRDFGRFTPQESLVTAGDLADWLRDRGFAVDACSEKDFARALALRSAIREIAASHQPGVAVRGDGPDLSAALDFPLRPRLDETGAVRLRAVEDGVRGALADIASAIVIAEAEGSWCRVKMCSAPDCRIVFYDGAKARNSRWCATAGCGNRMKTRTYRARRRADGA